MDLRGGWAGRLISAICALGLLCVPAAAKNVKKTAASSVHKASTKTPVSTSSKGKHKKTKRAGNWKKRGQQKMDPQRAREIQEALIREHYLDGEASGTWDDASQKAMVKFQADNGWQSKTVPDSRALIKLGLGPDHQHLLNPESAMTGPLPASPAQAKDSEDNPPQK